jgi:hypothetical protein
MARRFGELVQWEIIGGFKGAGDATLWLIVLMDCATNRTIARFVSNPSTQKHFMIFETWLRKHGRMVKCCSRRRSFFRGFGKTAAWIESEGETFRPTQIGRALQELDIRDTVSGSEEEQTMQRFSAAARSLWRKKRWPGGAASLSDANDWLEIELLPGWNIRSRRLPHDANDAHRELQPGHDLGSILSDVQMRRIRPDLTIRIDRCVYLIQEPDLCRQLAGATVRVEKRFGSGFSIRARSRPLRFEIFHGFEKTAKPVRPRKTRPGPNAGGKSRWNETFWKKRGPSLDQAIRIANATS